MDLIKSDLPLQTTWSETYSIMLQGNVIGHIVLNEHPDMYIIWRLEIFLQHRKQGYATRLFKEVIPKDKKVRLAVSKENKIAINLYKGLGFTIIGEKDTWYWMEYSNKTK